MSPTETFLIMLSAYRGIFFSIPHSSDIAEIPLPPPASPQTLFTTFSFSYKRESLKIKNNSEKLLKTQGFLSTNNLMLIW